MSGYTLTATITRPATTPTYAADDVVGATAAAFEFDVALPNAGQYIILSHSLRINSTGLTSGMTSYKLKLYRKTPPSALADAATWDLPAGDRDVYLRNVNLGSPADVGSTCLVETEGENAPFYMPGPGKLYGYLVTNGGYVGASGEVYKVILHVMENA